MNPIKHSRTLSLVALCLFAGTASAHTGNHAASGFAGGLAHPFMGLDHLLAMIAIGLWAAQQGGRALWAIPATFVAAMGLGFVLAGSGLQLPNVEPAIAVSVLMLGLLVAMRQHAPLLAGMSIAAVFALFHGAAHGLEMPQAASPVLYGLGFMLATACLHGVGLAGNVIGRHAMRLAGAAIAVTGLALVLAA